MLCRVHTIQVSYRGVVYTASHSHNICDSPPPVPRPALCVPGPAFSPDLDRAPHTGTRAQLKYAPVGPDQALNAFVSQRDP